MGKRDTEGISRSFIRPVNHAMQQNPRRIRIHALLGDEVRNGYAGEERKEGRKTLHRGLHLSVTGDIGLTCQPREGEGRRGGCLLRALGPGSRGEGRGALVGRLRPRWRHCASWAREGRVGRGEERGRGAGPLRSDAGRDRFAPIY